MLTKINCCNIFAKKLCRAFALQNAHICSSKNRAVHYLGKNLINDVISFEGGGGGGGV